MWMKNWTPHIVAITTIRWRRSAYINVTPYMALLLLIQVTLVQERLVLQKQRRIQRNTVLMLFVTAHKGLRKEEKKCISLQVTGTKLLIKHWGCLQRWRLGAIFVYKAASQTSKTSAWTKWKEKRGKIISLHLFLTLTPAEGMDGFFFLFCFLFFLKTTQDTKRWTAYTYLPGHYQLLY